MNKGFSIDFIVFSVPRIRCNVTEPLLEFELQENVWISLRIIGPQGDGSLNSLDGNYMSGLNIMWFCFSNNFFKDLKQIQKIL